MKKLKYQFKLGQKVKDNAGVICEVIARCRNVYGANTYVVKYETEKPLPRGLEGMVTCGQVWVEDFLKPACTCTGTFHNDNCPLRIK